MLTHGCLQIFPHSLEALGVVVFAGLKGLTPPRTTLQKPKTPNLNEPWTLKAAPKPKTPTCAGSA